MFVYQKLGQFRPKRAHKLLFCPFMETNSFIFSILLHGISGSLDISKLQYIVFHIAFSFS